MAKKHEMVPFGEYAIVKQGVAAVAEMIQQNIGRKGISGRDLDRIKAPAGGGISMIVPTLEGEDAVKEISGVVIYWNEPRAYWPKSIDDGGGGIPPDCFSDDGENGQGDPGGLCDKCKFAQFGSAKGGTGRGQACKQMQQIFLVQPESLIPIIVNFPPTSLQNSRQYFLRLSGRMMPYWQVITKFHLEKATNNDGVDYAKFVPTFGGKLDAEHVEMVRSLREATMPSLEQVRAAEKDFVEPNQQ